MKTAIFGVMAALSLALFVIPAAQGKRGPDLNVRLSGSSFITSSQDDGSPTPATEASTSLQSGIAKGSGSAIFSAQTVTEQPLPDANCPEALPFGNDLTTSIVLTYDDGSILSLSTTTDGTGSFCSDGVLFVAEFAGTVSGGDGRFEGASGTFVGSAQVDGTRLTGSISVDLD
jgi:hypothetical protein